eukprot:TRINITY_DN62125_c0_g1_i1.p1 TRINITY_DN62125_c0_g1~~TRINITY_DN62125_c0_g1_i1.p1  ORF type:complete len:996 (+),score=186.86 TRINITY_DN62125_c0_g1_i1:127-3114(+)
MVVESPGAQVDFKRRLASLVSPLQSLVEEIATEYQSVCLERDELRSRVATLQGQNDGASDTQLPHTLADLEKAADLPPIGVTSHLKPLEKTPRSFAEMRQRLSPRSIQTIEAPVSLLRNASNGDAMDATTRSPPTELAGTRTPKDDADDHSGFDSPATPNRNSGSATNGVEQGLGTHGLATQGLFGCGRENMQGRGLHQGVDDEPVLFLRHTSVATEDTRLSLDGPLMNGELRQRRVSICGGGINGGRRPIRDLRECWRSEENSEALQYWKSALDFETDSAMQSVTLAKMNTHTFQTVIDLSGYVIHPGSQFRLSWNAVCLLFICYDLCMLPMEPFKARDLAPDVFRIIEWFICFFWTIDLLLGFRTGYYTGAQLETNSRRVATHYLKTYFVLDFFVVGMEWIARVTGDFSSVSLLRTTRTMRAIRLARLAKLLRVAKLTGLWSSLKEYFNSNMLHLCITVFVLTIFVSISIHLTSCAWYAIGIDGNGGWTTLETYEGDYEVMFWYVAAARWAISQLNGQTDVDERRTMPERAFTCLVGIVLAVIVKAAFMSMLTKTLLDLSDLRSQSNRRRRLVNEYLERNSISPELTFTVKRHLRDYQDRERDAQKEEQVLRILPRHVQADVLFEIRAPILRHHNLMNSISAFSQAVMRYVCRSVVQPIGAIKNEIVFDTGDPCARMLFFVKGQMEYGDAISPTVVNVMSSNPPLQRRNSDSSTQADSEPLSPTSWRDSISTGRLARQKTDLGDMIAPKQVNPNTAVSLSPGKSLSEAALWLEWSNKGRLVAESLSYMYALDAMVFGKAMRQHADVHAITVLYARQFWEELQAEDQLSDICSFQVRCLLPEDMRPHPFQVTIMSARGLRKADFLGSSDPYVICEVRSTPQDNKPSRSKKNKRIQTPVIANNCSPTWDHTEVLDCQLDDIIQFTVWDHDRLRPAEFLGMTTLNASSFFRTSFTGELDLVGERATGRLFVKVEQSYGSAHLANQMMRGNSMTSSS